MNDQPLPPQPPTSPPDPPETAETAVQDGPRRLLRSRDDRVIAGVAGGLGRYFNVDPVLFRIALRGVAAARRSSAACSTWRRGCSSPRSDGAPPAAAQPRERSGALTAHRGRRAGRGRRPAAARAGAARCSALGLVRRPAGAAARGHRAGRLPRLVARHRRAARWAARGTSWSAWRSALGPARAERRDRDRRSVGRGGRRRHGGRSARDRRRRDAGRRRVPGRPALVDRARPWRSPSRSRSWRPPTSTSTAASGSATTGPPSAADIRDRYELGIGQPDRRPARHAPARQGPTDVTVDVGDRRGRGRRARERVRDEPRGRRHRAPSQVFDRESGGVDVDLGGLSVRSPLRAGGRRERRRRNGRCCR